nr:family S10 non peptidase ue (S10 family) [Hymenolepis microstoma]
MTGSPSCDLLDIEICEENVPRLCEEVRNVQVSHRLIEQINAEIEGLLERVLVALPTDSSDPVCFATVKYTSFTESSSPWRLLFMQMLITLPGESILALLRNQILSPNFVSSGGFNLRLFLSLISTIVVCCKRGISHITSFLHYILLSIFSSIPTKSSKGSSSQSPDLAALLDDSVSSLVSQSQSATTSAVDPMELKFIQFYHVLIIVRQVCVEDTRLTAFSYGQWWRENFSTSPALQKEGSSVGGVLATRRSLELLSSLLTRLLPFERNPVHLSTQLATPAPFWVIMKEKDKSEEEECCRVWNAYIDVARGRLAELRMDRGHETPEPSVNSIGWPSEVDTIVDDFMKIISNAVDPKMHKLPSTLIEMHLFRSAFLRDTVLPLLRNPPLNIPEEKRVACGILLRTVETRLLLRCADGSSDRFPRSPKKNVRGKRMRPRK